MARITINTEAGNRAISDGTITKVMGQVQEQWKPEAMYFTLYDSKRTTYMVFDLQDPADLPTFAEPLFQNLDAELEVSPAMDVQDLQRGLAKLS